MVHSSRDCFIRPLLAIGFAISTFIASPAAQQAPSQLIPVSVELGDVSQSKLAFIMAADYGIYERNGLKVRQFITPAAAARVRSVGVNVPAENVSSDIGDINIGGGSPTLARMTTIASAPRRIILATTNVESRLSILTRADITTPEQLRGKRFGFGSVGALDHFSLLMYFKKAGIDPERDVMMFSNGGVIDNILNDNVDAIVSGTITVADAKNRGLNVLVDLGQYHFVMPGSGVNALSDWLPKNRDAAARFMKATVEAYALMRNDKQAAFDSMKKWYGIARPEQMEVLYSEAVNAVRKPYPSIEGIKNMQSIYKWRAISVPKPEDFVDSSFVRDLDSYIDSLYQK